MPIEKGQFEIIESHAVIFECNGVEKIRFLSIKQFAFLDEEKAKEMLFEQFGFTDCTIIQID